MTKTKEDKKSNINLTKKQYLCLIRALSVADSVYGILGDSYPKEYKKFSNEIDELQSYILEKAQEYGIGDWAETFDGKQVLKDELMEFFYEVLIDYNEESFWNELETRLGQRDFARTVTSQEKKEINDRGGWLPERIHHLYEQWGKELEDHGLERLEVNTGKTEWAIPTLNLNYG